MLHYVPSWRLNGKYHRFSRLLCNYFMAYDQLLFYDLWLCKTHTQAQKNWSHNLELNTVICTHTRKSPYRVASYRLTRQDFLEQIPSWSRVLPGKLTDPLLIRKFPIFYGTRRFITAFTSARHLSVYWAIAVLSINPLRNILKVYFIIIFPSTPKYSKWYPSFRSSHQIPLYILHVSQMCHLPCLSHSF
jgi:hypothetical protein